MKEISEINKKINKATPTAPATGASAAPVPRVNQPASVQFPGGRMVTSGLNLTNE